MRRNTLRLNKRILIIIISSIVAVLAIAGGLTYAWISGAFNVGSGTKNPITYINVGEGGVIKGSLSLNQTKISKAVAFTNTSAFDVQIEEVLVSITFYQNETKYESGYSSPDISLVYTSNGTTKYHITPKLAENEGWTATTNSDNLKYTTTDKVVASTVNDSTAKKLFITEFTLSDITANYNFAAGTYYEITISVTTSPVTTPGV